MIHQKKPYTRVSDKPASTSWNYRGGNTDYEWLGLLQNNELNRAAHSVSAERTTGREFCGDPQPTTVPSRELNGLQQLLAMTVVFLTVTGVLCFVVWFFWMFVTGLPKTDIHALTDMIRGYR